ncbi:hypothetical protein ACFL4X_01100 [Gemmatimonadota bacterium]
MNMTAKSQKISNWIIATLKWRGEKIGRFFDECINPFSQANKIQRIRKGLLRKANKNLAKYIVLSERELRETRKSDTIVMFGSGYSLNEITSKEWKIISSFDTIGWNWFFNQNFVRLDYLLPREIAYIYSPELMDNVQWMHTQYQPFKEAMLREKHRNTVVIRQGGIEAITGNKIIADEYLPNKQRVFTYRNLPREVKYPPSTSFSEGLVHGVSTFLDTLNFIYLMGWKRVCIAGVDLYDRRYFWLKEDQTRQEDLIRNGHFSEMHNTAGNLLEVFPEWVKSFRSKGIELINVNKKSLLTDLIGFKAITDIGISNRKVK